MVKLSGNCEHDFHGSEFVIYIHHLLDQVPGSKCCTFSGFHRIQLYNDLEGEWSIWIFLCPGIVMKKSLKAWYGRKWTQPSKSWKKTVFTHTTYDQASVASRCRYFDDPHGVRPTQRWLFFYFFLKGRFQCVHGTAAIWWSNLGKAFWCLLFLDFLQWHPAPSTLSIWILLAELWISKAMGCLWSHLTG